MIKGITLSGNNYNSTIYTSKHEPRLSIIRKRTFKNDEDEKVYKPICISCDNLKPNTKYVVKLWYGSNHRGTAQMKFYHPYNSLYEAGQNLRFKSDAETSWEKLRRCSGHVLGLFNTYICSNGKSNKYPYWSNQSVEAQIELANKLFDINPEAPNADLVALRNYVLQTEWKLTTNNNGACSILIEPETWLSSLYRPNANDSDIGLSGTNARRTNGRKRGGHLTFGFSIEEYDTTNNDIYFSDNLLIVGNCVREITIDSDRYIPDYIKII